MNRDKGGQFAVRFRESNANGPATYAVTRRGARSGTAHRHVRSTHLTVVHRGHQTHRADVVVGAHQLHDQSFDRNTCQTGVHQG